MVPPPSPQVEVEAEVEVEEVEVEAEVEEEEEEEVVAEGYLQERHLQAEPHLFMESWEEIHQPNSMEIERKAELSCSLSRYTEE